MAVLHIHREEEKPGSITLRLEGRFDGPAAVQLHAILDELGSSCEVVLDFSHVREFLDLAVSILTRAIARRKVILRGLGTHQQRMLRYFGFVAPATPVVSRFDSPEDLQASP